MGDGFFLYRSRCPPMKYFQHRRARNRRRHFVVKRFAARDVADDTHEYKETKLQ